MSWGEEVVMGRAPMTHLSEQTVVYNPGVEIPITAFSAYLGEGVEAVGGEDEAFGVEEAEGESRMDWVEEGGKEDE